MFCLKVISITESKLLLYKSPILKIRNHVILVDSLLCLSSVNFEHYRGRWHAQVILTEWEGSVRLTPSC